MKVKKQIVWCMVIMCLFLLIGCEDKQEEKAKEVGEFYLENYYNIDLNSSIEIPREKIEKLDSENVANYASKSNVLLNKTIILKDKVTEDHFKNLLYGKDIERLMDHSKLINSSFKVKNIELKVTSHDRVEKTIELSYILKIDVNGEENRELEHQGNLILNEVSDEWYVDENTKTDIKDSNYEVLKDERKNNKITSSQKTAEEYLSSYFDIPDLNNMGKIKDEDLRKLVPQGLADHYINYAPDSIREGFRILNDVKEFCTDTFFDELKRAEAPVSLVDNAVKTNRSIVLSKVSFNVKQYDEEKDVILLGYNALINFGNEDGSISEYNLEGAIQLVELIDDAWYVKGESQQRIFDDEYNKILGK